MEAVNDWTRSIFSLESSLSLVRTDWISSLIRDFCCIKDWISFSLEGAAAWAFASPLLTGDMDDI
ncbi:hypothetical protein [Paenibacillus albidus]|uniref:hypothetical protein n=1 Tax=Paenibacillus albidus TaxID=2041023 RepID=UPI00288B57E5|nr:hypothetical protein [Paenibacillus albidus]